MKILLTYLMFLIPGQIVAGLIGLFIDPYSKVAAITVFIILYYAMFYLAWRGTLLVVDKPEASGSSSGGSRAAAASVLLAPALLALDFAE